MAHLRRTICLLGLMTACESDGTVREPDAGVSVDAAIANGGDPVQGGGLGGGALTGTLDVHVIHAQSGAAVPGATITVAGRALDADGAGHARFSGMSNQAQVNVTKAGFVPSRWVGVGAAQVTIPLSPVKETAQATARARVRITGLAALPARDDSAGYQVRLSTSLPLDLAGLDLAELTGALPEDETCRFGAGEVDDCTLEIETRVGPQRLYGVVEAVSAANEVIEPAALFVSDELELSAGLHELPGALSLLASGDVFRVALGRVLAPVDGAKVVGVPGMKLAGGVMVFPPSAQVLLPRSGGALGDGSYWYIADASYEDASGDAVRVRVAHRGIGADDELSPAPWPEVTARPVREGNLLTFGPILGSVRQVVLRDANGAPLFDAVMLGSAAQLELPEAVAKALARVESVETFAPFDPLAFALPDVLAETLQRVERASTFGGE